MAYDEGLAQRIRELLDERRDVGEKKMFGGLAFMLGGHMCVGVVKNDLMVRVGPDAYASALAEPDAREMDFTGKPMRGLIYVDGEAVESDARLEFWLTRGVAYAGSLEPK